MDSTLFAAVYVARCDCRNNSCIDVHSNGFGIWRKSANHNHRSQISHRSLAAQLWQYLFKRNVPFELFFLQVTLTKTLSNGTCIWLLLSCQNSLTYRHTGGFTLHSLVRPSTVCSGHQSIVPSVRRRCLPLWRAQLSPGLPIGRRRIIQSRKIQVLNWPLSWPFLLALFYFWSNAGWLYNRGFNVSCS